MKKLIFSFLFYFTFFTICLSQTKEETQNYIKLKFNDLNFGYNNKLHKKSGIKISDYDYRIDFNGKYLVITKNNRELKDNVSVVESTDIKAVDISEIVSLKFININDNEWKFLGDEWRLIMQFKEDYFPINFNNFSNMEINRILKNNLIKSEYSIGSSRPIQFNCENYNSETAIKLIKAFKHLVNINGGALVDDLF